MQTLNFYSRLLIYCCLALSLSAAAVEQPVSPEQGKATLAFAMLMHTTWPQEEQMKTFAVGVFGRDRELLRALQKEMTNRTVRGKPIDVLSIDSLSEARSTQILMVAPSRNDTLLEINRQLQSSHTLIVTDDSDDKRNVMINFTHPSATRLAFEVNRSNIVYAGMKLSKRILLFGGTELDVATIYKETEAALAEAVAKADRQRKVLTEQEAQLTKQRAKLAKQTDEIKRQSEQIKARESGLAKLENNLVRVQASLTQSKSQLKENEAMLAEKLSVLAKKEANIDRYSAQIEQNLTRLTAQQKELQAQEHLIAEKNNMLIQQDSTIRNQQFVLTAAVAALLLVLSLIAIIFRGYRSKQRINLKLVQMTESKSQFLSTMSHEIRTPLNGVLGMVELLKDTPINQQQRRYLDTIHTSGEVLLNVINDILDYSKIEAGKMPIEHVDFNLEKLIFGCASIFALRSTVDLTFVVDIPHKDPLHLKGDPMRIRQVLLNLLSNAFKFTARGEIQLVTREEPVSDDDQRWYRISVIDSGTGLSEEQCQNIFKAFAQADTSTTRRYGGTGLGLAISQRLANLMGGSLSVESELGVGSTFSMTLPLVPADTEVPPLDAALAGHSLLIADPLRHQQQTLAAHAEAWGMKVHTTRDLAATRDYLTEEMPDLIILAENIDNQPGLALAKVIAKRENAAPILLLSNAAAPIPAEQVKGSGVSAVLEMPIAPSVMREAMSQLLLGTPVTSEEAEIRKKREATQFSNRKVLVAEDNPVNQMVIKGLLNRVGINPEIANNGVEAVEHYQENCSADNKYPPYDLILMDCEMPELDGLGATRQIRALEAKEGRNHVAIVALTAHAMDEHRQRAISTGMDDHLAKPLKSEALEMILTRYCSG